MKPNKNQSEQNLELSLQPVISQDYLSVAEGGMENLEFILTNSAFGFEYALQELEEAGEYGFHAERIRVEIDAYKQTYFDARLKLKELDESKLRYVEDNLRLQKMVVFAGQSYLH